MDRSASPAGPITEARERIAATEAAYEDGADQPLGGYAGILAAYGLVLAAFAAVLRLTGRRLPERVDGSDLAIIAVATHKLSRVLSKDPVASPLRAPFTRFEGTEGPSGIAEEVRGEGIRKALGELVTCPFCVGHWIATSFVIGLAFAPRPTRMVAACFTASAASDALHLVYSALQEQES